MINPYWGVEGPVPLLLLLSICLSSLHLLSSLLLDLSHVCLSCL